MQFFIFVLLISLFIFLFCIYSLCKDDLVFLRKDVSMEKLFNLIFVGSIFSFFMARLFHGLFYDKNIFANPFVFLLFPYFSGLSLVGGIVGAILFFLFLQFRLSSSLPLGRIFDFFSVAFLIVAPLGLLGYIMFSLNQFSIIKTSYIAISYIILFSVFLKIFLPQLLSGKFKEGTVAFLFILCFSVVNFVGSFLGDKQIFVFKLIPEDYILIFMIAGSLFFLVKNENFLSKIRKFRR